MMTKQTEEALKMAISVISSINQGKQHFIVIDDDRGFFQREEWVRWAIDEVLPQIKDALAQPSVAELNNEYLRDTHTEGLQPLTRDWKETIDERIAKDDAFRQALAQPAQEPVAFELWKYGRPFELVKRADVVDEMAYKARLDGAENVEVKALYTHPAPSWQGLSDDEIIGLNPYAFVDNDIKFARAIEAKLKEKNNAL